jgi:transposase
MVTAALFPSARNLRCESVSINEHEVVIRVAGARREASCPACGAASLKVHSRYLRTLQDLPWRGKTVRIVWQSRKFRCERPDCQRQIFTERLPDLAVSHARKTCQLTEALQAIGLTCGGEGGARLAARLGMPTSADTLLRVVRQSPISTVNAPRVLGVDDWAFRRGHRYGTILCDLERHRIVDVLPERSAESLEKWLVAHPGVEVISRDRGDYYISGALAGAPQAVQVADRWHLLTNLRDALTRTAERFSPQILAAARAAAKDSQPKASEAKRAENKRTKHLPPPRARSLAELRRARRFQYYEQVHTLHRQQVSQREIARRLRIHRETVSRLLRAVTFPERAARDYRHGTDPFLAYLRQRWGEGQHNATQLTQELRQRGFQGSYHMVRRRVARWRREREKLSGDPYPGNSLRRPSAKQVGWLLMYPPPEETDSRWRLFSQLAANCPPLATASRLAIEFITLMKQQNADALEEWAARTASEQSLPELRRFAEGLKSDWSAVCAAFRLPWSNGQTEGHINRLKLIKRQMFGRAGFDLLRRRLLLAA